MRSSKHQIGAALDQLIADVKDHALHLCDQAEAAVEPHVTALMKQALTLPHLVRAQYDTWVVNYNATHGTGAAQAFLTQCLLKAGADETLNTIDQQLTTLENQALVLVNHRLNDGWTWPQVIAAVRTNITPSEYTDFSYQRLPIPAGYTTVWGEPW